jgi:hypothetical protein
MEHALEPLLILRRQRVEPFPDPQHGVPNAFGLAVVDAAECHGFGVAGGEKLVVISGMIVSAKRATQNGMVRLIDNAARKINPRPEKPQRKKYHHRKRTWSPARSAPAPPRELPRGELGSAHVANDVLQYHRVVDHQSDGVAIAPSVIS